MIIKIILIIYFTKSICEFRKRERHPIANALVNEAKKQNLTLLPIKNIQTESGRGISGELDSIDGIINIGSIEWLISKGVIIDSDSINSLKTEATKTNIVIGVSIEDKLIGFIILGDLLRKDSIKTIQHLKKNK